MSPGASSDMGVTAPDLRPFVPRGSLQWLRDEPGTTHRRLDASLLFVDISGFTAMSERLARLGPLGAEEVTDLLNLAFRELLSVAYEDDGSLLKFGGDALMLQFDGASHAHRAVHAATEMRRSLRALQPLESSVGQVRLRMSLGVHTGPVDQFLVGSHHRELLLVGPGVSSVVSMESAAGAGQIVVSQGVLDRLGQDVATVPLGPGHRLRSTVSPPASVPSSALPPDSDELASRLLPAEVRARLCAGVTTAEHRLTVIGFVAFTGTDGMLEREGPEATAAALTRLVDLVDEATARDHVCLLATDVAVDGGKFILTAGVPTSTESDGERMLRALRRLVAADPPVPLKIGVHAGHVFAGVVGPPFRLTYTVIGDAVNLAARVMGQASPGTVLATPEVLNRSQALFDATPVPPFMAKGKRRPVEALVVGDVMSVRARRRRARFPLAGRREEMATLLDACDAAADGPGRVVQLLGPAGLGKSRLVDELHERRPGRELVLVECSRYEAATPYHAVGRLVRDRLELSADAGATELAQAVRRRLPHLGPVLPLLGDVVGIEVPEAAETRDLTARFRADRIVAAAADLLHGLLPPDAVVVVEDAHWLDHESSRVVAELLERLLAHSHWLVVLTARGVVLLGGEDRPRGTLLALEPLGEIEARELVYSAVEEGIVSLPEGMRLLERSGGNPFFLEELLRVRQDGRELPDDVEALVQADLDTLRPEDRALLGHAAVLGEELDPALFAAVTGIAEAQQAAVWARLDAFLAPAASGTRRFRHALVRDVAYGSLPFRRRRELHRRAADALARSGTAARVDLLALHTFEAGDWAAARRHALAAAEDASQRYANLTAAEHYRRAVEAGRRMRGLAAQEVAAVWERLGTALMLASAYDDAVAAYRRAKDLADPTQQVHLCAQIGQLRERQARYREALWWYARGITLDRTATTGATPRLLVESGLVRIRQGRPREALALAERAGAGATDTHDRARVSYVRAWARMLLGQDGRADAERTLRLFRRDGDLIGEGLAWNIISMAAYHRGDWDEAAAAYEQARTLRRRVGDEVAAAVATGNLGELLADQGHGDRARPLLEEAHAVCAAAGYVAGEQFVAMTLGRLAAREGRYEEAASRLQGALAELERRGAAELVHHVHLRRAELHLFRGDLDAALDEATTLVGSELGGSGLRAAGQRVRTGVAIRLGDADRARREADVLLGQLADDAEDYETALSLVAAAVALELARDDRAPTVRARASRLLDRLGVVVPGERLALGPDVDLVTSSPRRST